MVIEGGKADNAKSISDRKKRRASSVKDVSSVVIEGLTIAHHVNAAA
jgi:hypothetical protein